MTGHLLGAGGAIEAMFCAQAIRDGIVPPTINLDTPDPECDLDYVPHKARKVPVRVAMSNSFGFGGHNATLVLKAVEGAGLTSDNIVFQDESISTIIQRYTREAGVRNLEREISSICRKVARKVVVEGKEFKENVTAEKVTEYLGVPRFRPSLAEERNEVGIATGLAWTEVGGELLVSEATLMAGKGKLTLTGKLGDVMQESAQAALSYVRSKAADLNLAEDFHSKIDIHVHVPEGAIPKDGPSAGITMTTALTSALTKNSGPDPANGTWCRKAMRKESPPESWASMK